MNDEFGLSATSTHRGPVLASWLLQGLVVGVCSLLAPLAHGFTLDGEDLTAVVIADWLSLILVTLAILIALIGLWSTFGRLRYGPHGGGARARNLFLSVRVTPDSQVPVGAVDGGAQGETPPKARPFIGHVLSLSPRSAVLIAPEFVARGGTISIDLRALPDFPTGVASPLLATVQSVRTMGAEPPSFLLNVRLAPLAGELRRPWLRYLKSLRSAPVEDWAKV